MNATNEIDSEVEIDPQLSAIDDTLIRKSLPNGDIIIGYLAQDEDCPNPCTDSDGMGNIRSFSRRHINNIDPQEARSMMKTDKMVVPLSYYEHGLCLWDVVDGERIGQCPDPQWDQVAFAGVWVPDDCCRDEIKSRSRKQHRKYHSVAIELAKQCCETYTDWSNGNCYGYIIERYNAQGQFQNQEDSCWGFIGDYAKEELQSAFDGVTE